MSDAAAAVGVIETDAFCAACGFNLHTQKVWRDDRLAILVCRCPECGAHHPAGQQSSVTVSWVRRLALVGLLNWILFALVFVVANFFMFFGMFIAVPETTTRTRTETRDGHPVAMTWAVAPTPVTTAGSTAGTTVAAPAGPVWYRVDDPQQTPVPTTEVVSRVALVGALSGESVDDSHRYETPLIVLLIMGGSFLLAGFVSGCLVAAFTWFWRRGRSAVWLMMPIVACGLTLLIESSSRSNNPHQPGGVQGRGLYYAVVIGALASQLIVVGAGLLVGRSVARFIVSVFIPPKARQLFAFLWHCDGRTMPAAAKVA